MNTMKTGRQIGQSSARPTAMRAGFTLIDVLVSIFVIGILIGMLLPKLSQVHEAGRRVVCQSNQRQIGIGLMSYANDYKGFLPGSIFLAGSGPNRSAAQPQNMDTLRLPLALGSWDGLGILFAHDYTNAPKVFYCPSHRGSKPFSKYDELFGNGDGEILSNYHYRGEGPAGHGPNGPKTRNLDLIDPAFSSLIADGLQLRSDYNHLNGVNFFRADLSAHWFSDLGNNLQNELPATKEAADNAPNYVPSIWTQLDASANAEAD
jgi:type II secretory pathway pseudopilin PulG